MNNIVIGIVGKHDEEDLLQIIVKSNLKYLHNKCSYIGIHNFDNYGEADLDVLKLCDGIIIPGGSIVYPYHYHIVDYCFQNNIPLMGICLGHQIIGLYNSSQDDMDLSNVHNHIVLDNKTHHVITLEGTLLQSIFGNDMNVNSRHQYALREVIQPFKVSALSDDNVIEGIELIDDNHWIVGVQWHPEDMDNMEALYSIFISEAFKRKEKKLGN